MKPIDQESSFYLSARHN